MKTTILTIPIDPYNEMAEFGKTNMEDNARSNKILFANQNFFHATSVSDIIYCSIIVKRSVIIDTETTIIGLICANDKIVAFINILIL